MITGPRSVPLERAVKSAPEGTRILGVRADVQDPEDATRAVEEGVKAFGGLDILINNAGVGSFSNVAEMTIADWDRTIGTNLNGVFYCCRAAIPDSVVGRRLDRQHPALPSKNAFAGGATCCATKAGLNAFSEAGVQEVRYDNIRVSCIMPGSVATGFGGRDVGADWKLAPETSRRWCDRSAGTPGRSLPSRVELRPSGHENREAAGATEDRALQHPRATRGRRTR